MKPGNIFVAITILFLSQLPIRTSAWDNKTTHRNITEKAKNALNDLELHSFVSSKFSIKEGADFLVEGLSLSDNMIIGSDVEDVYEGTTTFTEDFGDMENSLGPRSLRHFHDPLKKFSESGLSDVPPTQVSAIVWSDKHPENVWDLQDFQEYMHKSYTLPTEEERLSSLANMFRTAGHLLHLLQDMSVPAHVRDEMFGGHTLWMTSEFPFLTSPLEHFVKDRPQYIRNAKAAPIPSFEKFTDYFDTGSYRSLHAAPVSGPLYGLAEYTNSNFFSELQFFRQNDPAPTIPYPNPSLSDVYYWDEARDTSLFYPHLIHVLPPVFYSAYIGRQSLQPEQNITFLARVGFFDRYRINPEGNGAFFLDKACWAEYARKLLPQAIAYSAGLLEYLFRGDIDFEIESETNRLLVRNNSAHGMTGLFELYYDSNDGTRRKLEGHEWDLSIPARTSVFAPTEISLPRDLGAEKTVTLVFRGTLGAAEGVVTGKTTRLFEYDFTSLQFVEYDEIVYPSPYDQFSETQDPDRNWYYYRCKLDFRNALSDATVNRRTNFFFQLKSTPEISKKLGYRYTPGNWFYLRTNPVDYVDLVEYFLVETRPGEWSYLYDGSELNRDVGRSSVGYPISYDEGLFQPETGYLAAYRDLGAGVNYNQQCLFEDLSLANPDTLINLYYQRVGDPPQWVPECSDAAMMITRAEAYCDRYADFYRYSVQEAQPYMSVFANSEWEKFGFEVRFTRLVAANPARGDGVIHDGPVTLIKPYGSNKLTAY